MDNAFLDAELGPELNWQPASPPQDSVLQGRYVRLEPLDVEKHTAALFKAQASGDDRLWLYMGYGPFAEVADFRAYAEKMAASRDPFAYAVIPEGGDPAGIITYLRIDPAFGTSQQPDLSDR